VETQCTQRSFGFQEVGGRKIVARFDGGRVTSDGGAVLLREIEDRFRLVEGFAGCFTDHRDAERIEHPLVDLLKQRLFALCLGYEDLNDHDWLRHDALLAVIVGKEDPEGNDRESARDRGKALAGKSTLNRLELTPVGADAGHRYKKITADIRAVHDFLVDAFLVQHPSSPKRIVLDLDATDDPIHGDQLGKFFHGYYKSYCYLPLYIFCGDHPLLALLRPADILGPVLPVGAVGLQVLDTPQRIVKTRRGKNEIEEVIVASVLIREHDTLRILDTESVQLRPQLDYLTPRLVHIALYRIDLGVHIADRGLPQTEPALQKGQFTQGLPFVLMRLIEGPLYVFDLFLNGGALLFQIGAALRRRLRHHAAGNDQQQHRAAEDSFKHDPRFNDYLTAIRRAPSLLRRPNPPVFPRASLL